VTRSEGEVHLHKLDHHIRADLDAGSRRALGVLRPLRLVITNLPEGHFEEVEAKVGRKLFGWLFWCGCCCLIGAEFRCWMVRLVRGWQFCRHPPPARSPPAAPCTAMYCPRRPLLQYFPGRGDEGYKVPFTRVVYIEETDFREADSKDYYGLAPGKAVMLRWAWRALSWQRRAGGEGQQPHSAHVALAAPGALPLCCPSSPCVLRPAPPPALPPLQVCLPGHLYRLHHGSLHRPGDRGAGHV
jgi:hypothetical protein